MEKAVKSILLMKKLGDVDFDYEKHYKASPEMSNEELNIMFLGTISMKPC